MVMMRVNAAGGRMAPVLMRGELMRKRAVRDGCGGEQDSAWEPVAVELREDGVTVCSADKAQVLCTLPIGHTTQLSASSLGAAGHVNALSLSSSTGEEGEPATVRHLTLAASSETIRDKWRETLEACILKAQLQLTAVKAAAAAPSTPSRVDTSVSDECRRDEQIRTHIHTHAHTHAHTRMHTHT